MNTPITKRLALLIAFCVLACSAGAQIRPGHRILNKVYVPPPVFPTGALFYLRDAPTYYARNDDGTPAAWTDPDTGAVATQSTHTKKPTLSGKGLSFDGNTVKLIGSRNATARPCTISVCLSATTPTGRVWDANNESPCLGVLNPNLAVYNGGWIVAEPSGGIVGSGGAIRVHTIVFPAGNAIQHYRNGVKIAESTTSVTFDGSFGIGGLKNYDGYGWNGKIYAISAHDRELTVEEIERINLIWQVAYQ